MNLTECSLSDKAAATFSTLGEPLKAQVEMLMTLVADSKYDKLADLDDSLLSEAMDQLKNQDEALDSAYDEYLDWLPMLRFLRYSEPIYRSFVDRSLKCPEQKSSEWRCYSSNLKPSVYRVNASGPTIHRKTN